MYTALRGKVFPGVGLTPISKCPDVCFRDVKMDPFWRTHLVIKHTHAPNEGHNAHTYLSILDGKIKLKPIYYDIIHNPMFIIDLIYRYIEYSLIPTLFHVMTFNTPRIFLLSHDHTD